ncbi:hypothetical protein J6590_051553 [Homalodisca vitripennis]|nr:hypothetical protein J6590_051553 [Homalodisca vitripennis]
MSSVISTPAPSYVWCNHMMRDNDELDKTKPSGGPGAVWGRRGADRVTNVRVSAGRLAVVKIRGSQAARPALTSISPSLAP